MTSPQLFRRILVTGGAGYIGSHCCKELARSGFTPLVYDNLSTGNRDAVRWGELIEADVADKGSILEAMRLYEPLAVMHLAASAYVGESVADPDKYYSNNVGSFLSLLHACRQSGVMALVHSSSCSVYGLPPANPISEEMPLAPVNPYGRTKMICEYMLRDYAGAFGLKFAALRYFNAAGADPNGLLAEKHRPETHLIPRALMAAAGMIEYLEVFGNDYPTADGTCVRDYVHVTDLARAHVAALRALLGGRSSFAVNLGTGFGHSIMDVAAGIASVTGKKVPMKFLPRRSGDPPALVADPKLSQSILSYKPLYSDLTTIIRTAAPHFGFSDLRAVAAEGSRLVGLQ